eukprot:gene7751-15855_t
MRVTQFFVVVFFLGLNAIIGGRQEQQDALLFAAEMGHIEDIKKLIATGKIDLEMAWSFNPPLLAAATEGRLEVIDLLLNNGVDVNVQARDGTRAITAAAFHGHIGVLERLIKGGADLKFIDQAAGISNPLVVAASNNQVEAIKMLLNYGMEIDSPTLSGDTALILASLDGQLDAVKELIKAGANLEAKNHQGNTPMLAAAHKGRCDVVEELIRHGADANVRNFDSQFPLLTSASSGSTKCVREILKTGVDPSGADRLNNSAISMAARSNHVECVRLLIQHGADIEPIDDLRMTPLQHALAHNHLRTVKILALAGANFGSGEGHDGISSSNLAKVEACDWLRSILIKEKLPTIQQIGHKNKKPMKACEWMRHLGFDGSIVPLLDQVQLYGYAAMVRMLKFELFSRGEQDIYAVDAVIRKAYSDIKDMHSKEYRSSYRMTDEMVLEDNLPGLLKHQFGMNITLPVDEDEIKPVEEEPGEILPQIHRPKPEERPEFAKDKPGEEEFERLKMLSGNGTTTTIIENKPIQGEEEEDSMAAEL